MSPNVYFTRLVNFDPKKLSQIAKNLLSTLVSLENITLSSNLPIKIHPGAIGNTAYLRPELYDDSIAYLKTQQVKPYFVETCMAGGTAAEKLKEFSEHGFNELPIVIADGEAGDNHLIVPVPHGKYFQNALIARKLAESDQVLVVTHFKGHGMAGFGGALKMLGIGFASGHGKTLLHSLASQFTPDLNIDWNRAHRSPIKDKHNIHDWDPTVVAAGTLFRQRFAESAAAAAVGKNHLYLTYAINFSPDCDCNGEPMTPVYPDLGIFASTNPVAIDKAVMDLLEKREGKIPFAGSEIFSSAQSLGLGSTTYQLHEIK